MKKILFAIDASRGSFDLLDKTVGALRQLQPAVHGLLPMPQPQQLEPQPAVVFLPQPGLPPVPFPRPLMPQQEQPEEREAALFPG